VICERGCGELATKVATADGAFGEAVALLCDGHGHLAVADERVTLIALIDNDALGDESGEAQR
jgi:hypothetical protein